MFDWCGVRVLVVDDALAGIAAQLPAALTSWAPLPASDTGPPDIRYVVEPWRPAWGQRGPGFRVSRDGVVRYLGRHLRRLVRWVRVDIEEQAARRGDHRVLVRGAAVIWRGRAILLPGCHPADSSDLVGALLDRGAGPWADGLVLVDGQGRVHPQGGIRGPAAPPVTLVVATTGWPSLPWRSTVSRGARAVLPILDSLRTAGMTPRQALGLAARLAPAVVTLGGSRRDAAADAPRILAALDDLLDGSPTKAVSSPAAGVLARARRALSAQPPPTPELEGPGAVRW